MTSPGPLFGSAGRGALGRASIVPEAQTIFCRVATSRGGSSPANVRKTSGVKVLGQTVVSTATCGVQSGTKAPAARYFRSI
jgi:hypothetical protein